MSGEAVNQMAQQEEMINRWHRELGSRYPDLRMRWARIYGSRWAHFLGGSADVSFFPVKLVLNKDFGLCIENPEVLAPNELDSIISELRGAFA